MWRDGCVDWLSSSPTATGEVDSVYSWAYSALTCDQRARLFCFEL